MKNRIIFLSLLFIFCPHFAQAVESIDSAQELENCKKGMPITKRNPNSAFAVLLGRFHADRLFDTFNITLPGIAPHFYASEGNWGDESRKYKFTKDSTTNIEIEVPSSIFESCRCIYVELIRKEDKVTNEIYQIFTNDSQDEDTCKNQEPKQ